MNLEEHPARIRHKTLEGCGCLKLFAMIGRIDKRISAKFCKTCLLIS